MQFFRGQEREAFGQIKAHLTPEYTNRTGAGAVAAFYAIVENVLKQIEILLHGCQFP